MGTKAKEIVGADAGKIVDMLNKALSDEWLAYYQYWVGAKVAKGPMRGEISAELDQHATEELGHAVMLVDRIIQLGGTPVLKPEDWYKLTNCGYDTPTDPYVEKLLTQNVKGEQCAIDVYRKIMGATKDADPITYNMALQIMGDEIEHEEDLQALQEDIELVKKKA
jgi:bacterioferritin